MAQAGVRPSVTSVGNRSARLSVIRKSHISPAPVELGHIRQVSQVWESVFMKFSGRLSPSALVGTQALPGGGRSPSFTESSAGPRAQRR